MRFRILVASFLADGALAKVRQEGLQASLGEGPEQSPMVGFASSASEINH